MDRTDVTGKKEQILGSAWSVFMACGYDGTSMATLARAAGVSKGTLYNHFSSKEDLFSILVKAMCDEQRRTLVAAFPGKDASLVEGLSQIATAYIRCMIEDRALALYRLVISQASKQCGVSEIYIMMQNDIIDAIQSWLREIVNDDDAIDPEARDPVEYFLSACDAFLVYRHRLGLFVSYQDGDINKIARSATIIFQKFF